MANVISKGNLFPPEVTGEMINKVRGKSSLAALSEAEPVRFNGQTIFTFSLDKEVDVIAENGAKSNGGATIGTVSMTPVKIEYGTRVSDEFMRASEEVRLQYLRAFADGFARKAARGLDIMAFHGFNPRTGTASNVIGTNHFDSQVTQAVSFAAATANDNVEAAIALVDAAEHEVSGMAMSPAMRAALGAIKRGTSSNEPLFPELAWGNNPGTLNGLRTDTNATVSFNSSIDRAILGNFRDYFRWGYASDIEFKVIEYGNPDNDATAGDLQGHNQVYLRSEAYIGWAILDPTAFARIIVSSLTLDKSTASVVAGSTTTLTATTVPAGGTVTWTSSDTSIATVAGGVVTGVAAGTATITASYMGLTAKATVTVTAQ